MKLATADLVKKRTADAMIFAANMLRYSSYLGSWHCCTLRSLSAPSAGTPLYQPHGFVRLRELLNIPRLATTNTRWRIDADRVEADKDRKAAENKHERDHQVAMRKLDLDSEVEKAKHQHPGSGRRLQD